ncbi:MAG: AAA family ATPase [Desulfobacterales bacterium]|nr:AAA family ATPase [Desulfobacterales bacterium]
MPDKAKGRIIALCGKGGVGKTSISAGIIKILLADPQKKVLAIDADPAVGLATALGISVARTVDEIRNDLIKRVKAGEAQNKADVLSRLDYEILAALEERKNLAFLAIGRPENEGCYCQVNHMLKDIIVSLAANFDYVVIDGEAGIEQINRRVMEAVTHLLMISDASKKGLEVARTILAVADQAVGYAQAGLIINRLRGEEEFDTLRIPQPLSCLGWIPEDEMIRQGDMAGTSLLETEDGPAMDAIRQCLSEIKIFPSKPVTDGMLYGTTGTQ